MRLAAELDGDEHLDRDGLAVELRGLVLSLAQRAYGSIAENSRTLQPGYFIPRKKKGSESLGSCMMKRAKP